MILADWAKRLGTSSATLLARLKRKWPVEKVLATPVQKRSKAISVGPALVNRRVQHGMAGTTEYRIWTGMKQRCCNPKCEAYPNYGGRGIHVCQRWTESFAAFLEDVGHRPSPSHTLDRFDNNGPYAPENCRWATTAQQARNTRRSHRITFNGETRCAKDWGKQASVHAGTILRRLRDGWPLDEALSLPSQTRHHS